MKAALKAAGKTAGFEIYPGAPHGFHADYRPSYRKDAAEDAWQRMEAWFRTYKVLPDRSYSPWQCAALLPDRAVLEIAGEDRAHFLQGLVTNDVAGLREGEARFAGLLTPQGKILFDFFIVRRGESFLLDCPRAGDRRSREAAFAL